MLICDTDVAAARTKVLLDIGIIDFQVSMKTLIYNIAVSGVKELHQIGSFWITTLKISVAFLIYAAWDWLHPSAGSTHELACLST